KLVTGVQTCALPIYLVVVPSAFTPNNDNANDILFVRGGPLKEMDWRIYNEWGNEIFHATDQSKGWDGTYHGQLQSASRYVYTLRSEERRVGKECRAR